MVQAKLDARLNTIIRTWEIVFLCPCNVKECGTWVSAESSVYYSVLEKSSAQDIQDKGSPSAFLLSLCYENHHIRSSQCVCFKSIKSWIYIRSCPCLLTVSLPGRLIDKTMLSLLLNKTGEHMLLNHIVMQSSHCDTQFRCPYSKHSC